MCFSYTRFAQRHVARYNSVDLSAASAHQQVYGALASNKVEALLQQDSPRKMVIYLFRAQLGLSGLALFMAWFLVGVTAAGGVMLGAAIGIVLTLVFALRMFAVPTKALPQQIVIAFYRAEALKLLAAAVLFVLVARWAAHIFGPVMIGYVVTLLAHWIVGIRGIRDSGTLDEGH